MTEIRQATLERWQMGDPAKVCERMEEMRLRRKSLMNDDQSEEVEGLLVEWYGWARAQREFLGHSRVSPMFRNIDWSEVHDTGTDVDARLHNITAEMVEACLGELKVLERAAIEVHLRNRGAAVFRNPRLGSPEQHHHAYLEAKEKLFPILRRKGLVKAEPNKYARQK